MLSRRQFVGVAAAALVAACDDMGMKQQAASTKENYEAHLSGANSVPRNNSNGEGDAKITLDTATRMVTWKITYKGLSGPATAAHFHGPAAPGTNAGVAVPFTVAPNTIEGSATLTPQQMEDLQAGRYYINIHTQQFPGGEIRGQVML
jgi:hypothetical protein